MENVGDCSVIYYIIAIIDYCLDQLTKWLIVKNMNIGESIQVIENFFYITSHRNKGAAWGILEGQMLVFLYRHVIGCYRDYLLYANRGKGKWLLGVSLAFMLGGAIGNFIDRVIRKEVVDFIDTYIFTYDFPIFNIADSALTIGVRLVDYSNVFERKRIKGENTDGDNRTALLKTKE